MNRNASALAAAITATLGTASVAEGAPVSVTLTAVTSYSGNGSSAGNIASSDASFDYDDVTGLLTQTGGTFNVRFTITPTTTLFRHSIEGLVIGNGAAATASTYQCTEGNFGPSVGASLCGNYNFGANFLNESTVTWGPGTATARTQGGDDGIIGPQQSIAAYDGFSEVSWVGTTLTLRNAVCNPAAPGNASGCATTGGFNSGYTWTLQAPLQEAAVDDDAAPTTRNVAAIIPVLANDAVNDPVTLSVDATGTNGAANASIVINGTNPGPAAGLSVTYTPNVAAGTAGPIDDTFTYTANGKTATVSITVNNNVPNAVGGDLSAISTVGVAPAGLTGTFTAPGSGGSLGDGGTASVTAQGTKGTATISGNTITYTIDDAAFFEGADSFTYSIADADTPTAETSGPVTVNVTIPDANPTISDASVDTDVDTAVVVTLTFTAGNGSPAQHTFAIDTNASNGDCTLSGTTLTYTPDAGFVGTDSCVVSITDGDGDVATATITIDVNDNSGTGLREDDGGSSADWLILSLLGGSALIRRRRRRQA